jgi:tripartite-type tricarboxylate transporter receptor subunit TctC
MAGRILCAFLLAGTVGIGTVSAQGWPTRTITPAIPFAPGNASDITALVVLDQVSKQLGQQAGIQKQ